ncbi:MAG: fatty acyl-AMP ligase [Desulfobacterales bacterium]|jgi:fatty-acyl-CoA synthase
MKPTTTIHDLPLRLADFENLAEALDYAAKGDTGANFYKKNGQLDAVLPYAQLRDEAQTLARRLLSLNPERGVRVALVAETHPDFLRFFFACQYAGLVPVPLPISIHLGGFEAFVAQLHRLLMDCRADLAVAPQEYLPFLNEAASSLNLTFCGSPRDYDGLPVKNIRLQPSASDELAYLQYTSGSTRFPRGVMITQQTVMNNLSIMTRDGIKIRPGDRGMSWLPFYHDMGLVGLVLGALATQMSVDYLSPLDFVMRPRLWLTLMSQNRATISFSPPVGYELALKRIKKDHIDTLDLSAWRVAGVGAEPIRIAPLNTFAEVLKPSGFDQSSFIAGYGMAETSLAVSFSPLGKGLKEDYIDPEYLAEFQTAIPVDDRRQNKPGQVKSFVNCGEPLPGYEIQIRDSSGLELPERKVGTLFVRGPSVMTGYFEDAEATRDVFSPDGWLNTGDLAYRIGRSLFITGREKDMIIINGRNIWPQDLEYLAEYQPEVRSGNASAFSVPGPDGYDQAVLVIQCRKQDEAKSADLTNRVQKRVREEFGIDCFIELVPRHTLPRTTSGKLSRSKARQDFLNRKAGSQMPPVEMTRMQTKEARPVV